MGSHRISGTQDNVDGSAWFGLVWGWFGLVWVGVAYWPNRFGRGSKPIGSYFGGGAPPILEPIVVGIGMFIGVRFRF